TSAGEWVVIESKGRTNEYDDGAMTTAKQQTQLVISIGGMAPVLRVAGQAHFEGGILGCSLADPETKRSKRPIDLPLSRDDITREYYSPFRTWLNLVEDSRAETVRGRPYTIARVPDVDVEVGLPQALRFGEAAVEGAAERFLGDDRTFI